MRSVKERHATPELVVARARELRRAGYIVLASEAPCGHWNGFSAFHPDRREEAPIAIECETPLSLWGDREAGLKAVYEPDA